MSSRFKNYPPSTREDINYPTHDSCSSRKILLLEVSFVSSLDPTGKLRVLTILLEDVIAETNSYWVMESVHWIAIWTFFFFGEEEKLGNLL